VAQGLSAINTYIGSEQDPADYARMVSNDLMGITRDDLAYDLGRVVDDSVHLFEEWGLPIWKTDAFGRASRRRRVDPSARVLPALKDGGKPVRSAQVADHDQTASRTSGIVAEAAKKALGQDKIQERILHRPPDQRQEQTRTASPAPPASRFARTRSSSTRQARSCSRPVVGVNLFRPRSVGEGTGRAWYPVWNARLDLRDARRGRRPS